MDNTISIKQRVKAFLSHLVLSVILVLVALYLIYGIWYPQPLNLAVGVSSIYLIMLSVDFILGPLCTLIVYKADKKKLIFDVIVILIIQLTAYSYGLWTIEKGRPAWQVFVVDDIELVSPINLYISKEKKEFEIGFFESPQWVAAVYSSNPKIAKQQKEDEMFDGISLATRPETYQPIQVQSKAILGKLQSLDKLQQFNSKEQIEKELHQFHHVRGWLPVKAPNLDLVAIFDKDGQPLGVVNLRPWND
ncbi:type4 fimbrial accessory protein [Acinetobacter sp. SK-43]|nr:type4 fimbrial accessory protein [Acinetobacter sp. SK-43]